MAGIRTVEGIAIDYMIRNRIEPCDWHLTRQKGKIKSLVYYEKLNGGRGNRVVLPWEEVRASVVVG